MQASAALIAGRASAAQDVSATTEKAAEAPCGRVSRSSHELGNEEQLKRGPELTDGPTAAVESRNAGSVDPFEVDSNDSADTKPS